ncbi:hypothetical protein EV424DRAFT_1566121 [Suillus variegatus]|nr:hypothetical protein EV424DRAFT_1566121 [Suillus variegatus]
MEFVPEANWVSGFEQLTHASAVLEHSFHISPPLSTQTTKITFFGCRPRHQLIDSDCNDKGPAANVCEAILEIIHHILPIFWTKVINIVIGLIMRQYPSLPFAGRLFRRFDDNTNSSYPTLSTWSVSNTVLPIMALTATANKTAIQDIHALLGLRDPLCLMQSFNRPNLYYAVQPKPSMKKKVVQTIAGFIRSQNATHTGIVYGFSKLKCEELAEKLRNDYGSSAKHYHAESHQIIQVWCVKQWRKVVSIYIYVLSSKISIKHTLFGVILHHLHANSPPTHQKPSNTPTRQQQPTPTSNIVMVRSQFLAQGVEGPFHLKCSKVSHPPSAAIFRVESAATSLAGVVIVVVTLFKFTDYTIPKPNIPGREDGVQVLRVVGFHRRAEVAYALWGDDSGYRQKACMLTATMQLVRYDFEALLMNKFHTLNGTCSILVSVPHYFVTRQVDFLVSGAGRWTAPEFLLSDDVLPMMLSDINSFGNIMLQEVITIQEIQQGNTPRCPSHSPLVIELWPFICGHDAPGSTTAHPESIAFLLPDAEYIYLHYRRGIKCSEMGVPCTEFSPSAGEAQLETLVAAIQRLSVVHRVIVLDDLDHLYALDKSFTDAVIKSLSSIDKLILVYGGKTVMISHDA